MTTLDPTASASPTASSPRASALSREPKSPAGDGLWSIAQRVAAFAMLIAASPLMLAIAIAIRLESAGPALFRQRRPGLGGRPFTIFKFRTMARESEATTALGVRAGDARITRVGGILRKLKLDELPQLINVARGDMMLVGPRPIPIPLDETLRERIDGFDARYAVRPGMTSLSQIAIRDNGLDDKLLRDWRRRLEGERFYLHHRSVWLDLTIIGMTAVYVLRKLLPKPSKRRPTPTPRLPSHRVLGIPVTHRTRAGVQTAIATWIERDERACVGVTPAHSLVEALFNRAHRTALRHNAINTPDGMPVVWLLRALGHRNAERVYGPTLMQDLLAMAANRGWRVALVGGSTETLEAVRRRARHEHPGLNIVAAISPPFGDAATADYSDVLATLDLQQPQLTFVALGSPKQEIWMRRFANRVDGVMVGVGAAFDFLAGRVRQAPPRWQAAGLEWLFRLACEPRRLWKRYAVANPIFATAALAHIAANAIQSRPRRARLITKQPSSPSENGNPQRHDFGTKQESASRARGNPRLKPSASTAKAHLRSAP